MRFPREVMVCVGSSLAPRTALVPVSLRQASWYHDGMPNPAAWHAASLPILYELFFGSVGQSPAPPVKPESSSMPSGQRKTLLRLNFFTVSPGNLYTLSPGALM